MTISTITIEFNQKTCKNLSNCFIRSMMKHKMGYLYRTISNRVTNSQTKKNKMMKVLFWTKQMSLHYSRIILVNIDESSFDRSLHKRYSWLPLQGSKISITNKPKEKWNLILATFSDGNWFAYEQRGILSSQHFCLFLKLLTKL